MQNVLLLGAGKMGETLITALLDTGAIVAEGVVATARHRERLDRLEQRFDVAGSDFSRPSTSSPLRPGSIRSRTSRSQPPWLAASSPSSPSAMWVNDQPRLRTCQAITSAISVWS